MGRLDPRRLRRRLDEEGWTDRIRGDRHRWSRFHLLDALAEGLRRDPDLDAPAFLAGCGVRPSRRHGPDAILLWHATTERHADKIRAHGFFHHGGVFFAPPTFGAPFKLADGIDNGRIEGPADLAVFGCLFDRGEWLAEQHYEPGRSEYRFRTRVSPAVIAYVVRHDGVETVDPDRHDALLPPATFTRVKRGWRVTTRNPQHLGRHGTYATLGEWLDLLLSVRFAGVDRLTLGELVNGIYCLLEPREALPIDSLVVLLVRRCWSAGQRRGRCLLRLAGARPRPG